LAKTHSRLSFDELCEEAFGSGLHPWEFYSYDLHEYLLRRKGLKQHHQHRYQEMIIAAMVPHMDKHNRLKIVNEAFKGDKDESAKEKYNRIQQRFAGILDNGPVKRNKNSNRG
jgi:hypothetical protein